MIRHCVPLKNSGTLHSSALALAFLLAVTCTACNAQEASEKKSSPNNPPPKLTVEKSQINRDLRAPISYAPVIAKVTPAVVTIYSTQRIKERPITHPLFRDDFFRRFFGDPGDLSPREREAQGLGSGVIVSPNGYILTANHVVEGADTVKVALPAGDKQFDAQIIGHDPLTDIAVLRINATQDFPVAVLGDSDNLQVGDTVLAIGNPFNVGQTVTMGIISALSRGGFGISAYENFIQADAAINPGNSGGALVDAEGRLIGINTAIMGRSGGFQGVGFAVPINMARNVMDQLIKSGKVSRGYLGISIQPLTPELAKEFGLPDESSGVLVGGVLPRGAAAKAGLKDGDVVIEVNSKKITDPRSLQLVVSQTPPGSKISLKILRTEPSSKKPTQKSLTATLAELPQNAFSGFQPDSSQDEQDKADIDALDGVEVTDLDNRLRKQFDIPQNIRGALVSNVDPDSNAAKSGLTAGDVILEINRQPVQDADAAVNLSTKATGDRILLRIYSMRSAGTRYLVVDNTKK